MNEQQAQPCLAGFNPGMYYVPALGGPATSSRRPHYALQTTRLLCAYLMCVGLY